MYTTLIFKMYIDFLYYLIYIIKITFFASFMKQYFIFN